ncbi:MAG: hypothetical protein FJW69_03380 [Actinobacteria bacterium]|nr:hypothetical protein [Actinomycetota bacterium]
MTSRERFLKIMNFESCKRTLKWEFGYWGGTINRWYAEGMEKVKGLAKEVSTGEPVLGSASPFPHYGAFEDLVRAEDVDFNFNLDEGFITIPYNYWIFPTFEESVIFEDERYTEKYGKDGIRVKQLKDNSSMPLWLEFPVKDRVSWERIKEERFNLENINKRYAKDLNSFAKSVKERSFPLGILNNPTGFFGSIRSLVGEQKLFLLYYDDPELVRDIANHLCQLWLYISEELTSKMDYDIAFFWEDMSGKNGPLISPSTFREFMSPYYKKLITFLKSRGVKNFVVDTDGNVEKLIPLFMEVGINIIYPFERQADNDLVAIRKKYPSLGMMGGFDKNALSRGKFFIDEELDIIKYLITKGGYIPFGDHLIPPNCSWENFKYYRERLNRIIDSAEVL